MHSERMMPSLGERAKEKKDIDQPSKARVVALLLSGLIHGGGTLAYVQRHNLAEQIQTNFTDSVNELFVRIKVAKQEARLRGNENSFNFDQAIVKQLKEGEPPPVDLSDVYISTEALIGDYSEQDIAKAAKRYEEILAEARALRDQGKSEQEVMDAVLKEQGHYDEHEAMLMELLLENKGNCESRMKLMTAAAQDLYPQWTDDHALFVQNYPEWRDDRGVVHSAHVRAVVEQGADLLVLEGDKSQIVRRSPDAQLIDAQWLAVAGPLVKQGTLSYKDLGYEDSPSIESESTIVSTTIMSLPKSYSAGYAGTANQDNINESVSNKSVTFLGELTDKQVAEHNDARYIANREKYADKLMEVEHKLRDWTARHPDMGTRILGGSHIDLSESALIEPLTDEQLREYANITSDIKAAPIYLRPGQRLPPHAKSILADKTLTFFFLADPSVSDLLMAKEVGPYSDIRLHGLSRLPDAAQMDAVNGTNLQLYFEASRMKDLEELKGFDRRKSRTHVDLSGYQLFRSGSLDGLRVASAAFENNEIIRLEANAMVGAQVGSLYISAPDVVIDPNAFAGAQIKLLKINASAGSTSTRPKNYPGVDQVVYHDMK